MIELWAFGAAIILSMAVLSFYQQRNYRNYLARHTAETEKVTENQRRLIEQTERGQALTERQIAELKRIADALEAKTGA